MTDETDRGAELHRLRRMLGELHDIAEHASLTGTYSDGRPSAVARYNAMLRRIIELQAVPEGMFDALPAEAGFGQIGIESRLLAGALRHGHGPAGAAPARGDDDDEPASAIPDIGALIALAPFVGRSELTGMVRNAIRGRGRLDPGMLLGLAPFLEEGEIGKIVREHMSDWFAPTPPVGPPSEPPNHPEPPAPPEPPTPPEPPSPPVGPPQPPSIPSDPFDPSDAGRLSALAAQLRAVADQMRDAASRLATSQSPEEQARLADEIAELANERAALVAETKALADQA